MQEWVAVLGQQALARIRSAWQVYVSGRMAPVVLSVAAAYYVGAHVGFMLQFPGSPLSIIWPPNAILLTALLLVPTRRWWVVLLAVLPAHVLVEAQNGVPPWTLLGWYLTNCGEAVLAAVGVRRFTKGLPWFATVRQVAIYIAWAALVAPFVTSFLDPAVVVLTHWDTSQHYWLLWQERFVSDVLTYLTVPPVLLMMGAGDGPSWLRTASRQRRLEAALLALSVLGAAYLVFHTPLGVAGSLPALLYAPVPVLLWATFRFGVGGSSAALLGLTLLSATSQAGSAVFDTHSPAAGVLALQVFLIVVSAPTLLLAALAQERRQADEALRRSEMRFRRLADSGMIGLKVGDGEGRIVAANDAFLALVGYSQEDLAAGRLTWAAMTPPDYAAQDARAVAQLRTAHTCAPYEKEYVRKDGRRVPVLIGGTVLEEEEGMAHGAIFFVLDLSEQKRAEEALRELAVRRQTEAALRESEARLQQANLELARASRLKSAFLANMSHEIRTPLNGVLGLAHLLQDTPLDARQQEYAAGIQSSGAALLALISDILDLSKIEAGEMALERAPVDLRALVADVVEVVAAPVRAKELALVSCVDPAVPPVLMGDPTRLRQVLLNLVGNAVKFTERGGVAVRVGPANPTAGRSADEEGCLLIRGAVEDTGIGIAPEARARLFDAFAQADETTTRRYGGTGLGLAICKQLIELMGGKIGVDSVLKVGSTFWFTARLGDAEAGGTHAAIPARDESALDGTALLVGGPAPVRAALHDQLAAWGLRVEEAADAAGALDAVREGEARGGGYDVALVDEQLPDMSGVELARRLRGAPAAPPLLLLTARDRVAGDALPAGIAAWLANPVRPAQLYGAVAQLVGHAAPVKGVGTQEHLSPVAPAQVGARGGRILVAEDNPVNQLVTVHLVAALGYQVETAEDGRGAVTALERGAYDLVLMDCHMPTMDGFTATAEIRRWEERSGRHTPIIALTADALSGDAAKCLAAGMDDYLAKPVTSERLREVVARWAS